MSCAEGCLFFVLASEYMVSLKNYANANAS
jgi:hypothetical protein